MTRIRNLTTNELLEAIGTGSMTFRILQRIEKKLSKSQGEHLLLAQLRRRLRVMERDGLIRVSPRLGAENCIFWEPVQ